MVGEAADGLNQSRLGRNPHMTALPALMIHPLRRIRTDAAGSTELTAPSACDTCLIAPLSTHEAEPKIACTSTKIDRREEIGGLLMCPRFRGDMCVIFTLSGIVCTAPATIRGTSCYVCAFMPMKAGVCACARLSTFLHLLHVRSDFNRQTGYNRRTRRWRMLV